MRGGERVVEALGELYPQADIFTHVYDSAAVSDTIRRHNVTTTFIGKLPFATRHYQKYLPLMPLALEQFDLREYDLIICSESGPTKGVLGSPDSLHICYCHTPMRYLWDMYPDYLNSVGAPLRLLMRPLFHYLRLWDVSCAARVDHLIANSSYVARRIMTNYRRQAEVIHPPVATTDFVILPRQDDFYLMVGQLVDYKRTDLAVQAFNRTDRRLVIIGKGEQMEQLKAMAGPNVTVMGWQPFEIIRDYYARCRALIFPGVEDFGIVPLEAMASGRPVIALGRGGALETVVDGQTGVLFKEQSPQGLLAALERFEQLEDEFDPDSIAAHARRFDRQHFKQRIQETIQRLLP